ncbi:hypothetical protein OAA62_01075 [bacterium]|nr:hypothetical protein [bacterium]
MRLSNLRKKSSSLGQRFYTLELAFNILENFRGKNISQVGCQSKEFEYANFDLFNIFADYVTEKNIYYDIYVNFDDINLKSRIYNIQRQIYSNYNSDNIRLIDINKSINKSKIDLLLLNDICYPINEITKQVSKELNYLEAINLLHSLSEEDINTTYGDIINPCREKMLKEYSMFENNLNKSSIVLLEGNDYPGGSQTKYVKKRLSKDNFNCLLDLKQSVWMKY